MRLQPALIFLCSRRAHVFPRQAYGCLNGGTLSGKYLDSAKPDGARHTLFPKFQSRRGGKPERGGDSRAKTGSV